VIFLLILFGIILCFQEWNNQNIAYNSTLSLKKERDKRDSLITVGITNGVDQASGRLFQNLSKSFLKQNLKIDTLKNTITVLQDSVRRDVVTYRQKDPVISIDNDGIYLEKDNEKKYKIRVISLDAGSTNYQIDVYLLTETPKLRDLSKFNLIPYTLQLSENGKWTTGFTNNFPNPSTFYLYLKGSYTNIENNKKYQTDVVYKYDVDTKQTSILGNSSRNAFFKSMKDFPVKDVKLQE
jgi:hypothetical protein